MSLATPTLDSRTPPHCSHLSVHPLYHSSNLVYKHMYKPQKTTKKKHIYPTIKLLSKSGLNRF